MRSLSSCKASFSSCESSLEDARQPNKPPLPGTPAAKVRGKQGVNMFVIYSSHVNLSLRGEAQEKRTVVGKAMISKKLGQTILRITGVGGGGGR